MAAGWLADLLLADPRRGHPVALFGTVASSWERLSYSDGRAAGTAHTAVLLGGLAALGLAVDRAAARRGPRWTATVTAVVTFFVLGGTSLSRTGSEMASRLERGNLERARALVPSLCGRDPASLDEAGIARATVESVAENTCDAQVAPLWWGALGGVTGLLVYRGANTLDAMIGHRSPRYERFGWAAARFDDVLNYLPARATGLLVAACAPAVGAPWRGRGRLAPGRGPTSKPQRRRGGGGVRRGSRYPARRPDAVRPPARDPADPGGGAGSDQRRHQPVRPALTRRSGGGSRRRRARHDRLP